MTKMDDPSNKLVISFGPSQFEENSEWFEVLDYFELHLNGTLVAGAQYAINFMFYPEGT
jgi:hypothetical protein